MSGKTELLPAERGTLTAEQVFEVIERCVKFYDGGDYDAQEIADELNAELGGGNCARCAEDMGRYADSLCDPLKERIAELLRCLENDWHIHASWDGLRKFWCIELTEEGVKLRDAAHAERTCHDASVDSSTQFYCSECECTVDIPLLWGEVNYCPNCGCKVVDA